MAMTTEQYVSTLATLTEISRVIKTLPLEDLLETIQTAETHKSLHRPSKEQEENVGHIKKAAQAALGFQKAVLEIAASAKPATRIILPGSVRQQ